ncbi:hypothetical protein SUGI_1018130 [Cryptomeria japonica]|nr:hypothetical protein SUGI_1018130 [Cryptomeria japonica]
MPLTRSPGVAVVPPVAPTRSPVPANVILPPTRSPGVATIPPVAPACSPAAIGGSAGVLFVPRQVVQGVLVLPLWTLDCRLLHGLFPLRGRVLCLLRFQGEPMLG